MGHLPYNVGGDDNITFTLFNYGERVFLKEAKVNQLVLAPKRVHTILLETQRRLKGRSFTLYQNICPLTLILSIRNL